MPIYEYRCEKCDNVFEVLQSGFDEREETCPKCKGVSKRIISNTSFVLKGSGWYVTDYAGKNPSTGSGASGGENGNGNGDGAKAAKSDDSSSSAASAASAAPAKADAPAKPSCACGAKSACAGS